MGASDGCRAEALMLVLPALMGALICRASNASGKRDAFDDSSTVSAIASSIERGSLLSAAEPERQRLHGGVRLHRASSTVAIPNTG